MQIDRSVFRKINDYLWEIPQSHREDMRVPARIYASKKMFDDTLQDRSLWQLVNIATLPGIQNAAIAMPDIHEGYGFPIGGIAAMRVEDGVVSPGGIGYDINCGVRLLASSTPLVEMRSKLDRLADEIFARVPSGVGRGGRIKLTPQEMDAVLEDGVRWAIKRGYGTEDDAAHLEENGSMPGTDPSAVSERAKLRGRDQLGTLGSGNHFLEVQVVDEVFEPDVAKAFNLFSGNIAIMIHCGSRGLGHQVCTDYVRLMLPRLQGWGIELPDRELACAPIASPEGKRYFGAMTGAANFAWTNRHIIAHNVREAWKAARGTGELKTVYDVAHNIGKIETHEVGGKSINVCLHRKGATRAFGPGQPDVPEAYRMVGQPVLIPGTMGTASYVLVGTNEGMRESFGTSCHGAGRRMSRAQAKRTIRGSTLRQALEKRGIIIRCESDAGLAEEAPEAYKDVEAVVEVVHRAGLAKKVARLKPVAVVKGG